MTNRSVYCQLLGGIVTPDLCREAQGGSGCRGCSAITRLCERCRKRIITNPSTGRCDSCPSATGTGRGKAAGKEASVPDLLAKIKHVTEEVIKPPASRPIPKPRMGKSKPVPKRKESKEDSWEQYVKKLRQYDSFLDWERRNAFREAAPAIRALRPMWRKPMSGSLHSCPDLDQDAWIRMLLDGCGMRAMYLGQEVLVALEYRTVYPLNDTVLDSYQLDERVVLLSHSRWPDSPAKHCLVFADPHEARSFMLMADDGGGDALLNWGLEIIRKGTGG